MVAAAKGLQSHSDDAGRYERGTTEPFTGLWRGNHPDSRVNDAMQGAIEKAEEILANIRTTLCRNSFGIRLIPDVHRRTTAKEILESSATVWMRSSLGWAPAARPRAPGKSSKRRSTTLTRLRSRARRISGLVRWKARAT